MGDRDDSVQFKRKHRSVVWNHFTRRKKTSTCNHCGKTFTYLGETNNLRSHLKASHSVSWTASLSGDEDDDAGMTVVGTKLIDSYIESDSRKVCSNARAGVITNLLVDWISVNSRSISVVEDAGLQQLFEYLEPAYSLPSCTQVASIVKNVMPMVKKVYHLYWRKKPASQQ